LLHNHQPVGNFDSVFEEAFQKSYRPFLEVFQQFSPLKISLHISGPLLEWLEQHHSEYLESLARLVAEGRVEIIGGAFYEPILAMIPSHDRVGQIVEYREHLRERFRTEVRGMWVAERVWEQSFTKDLADAGVRYTVLDDFHFKSAGLNDDQLFGPYVTEDEGRLLAVFPGSERLRYTIPFADPQVTIEYLREVGQKHRHAVAVLGDDGEKFGSWPDTFRHVYEDRWLERFFETLLQNSDWLEVTTLGEAFEAVPPLGKIYLPDCSYREMTEWILPIEKQQELEDLAHEFENDARWPRLRRFMRGGFWRNFRVKYPESNEMYSRMLGLSFRLQRELACETTREQANYLEQARRELYRAQCNCGYWHGAFGGIYLPHLRNAIYHHLIAAEEYLDAATRPREPWIEDVVDDFNFDARLEVRLANDKLAAYFAPMQGGHLYELDIRSIRHNLLATLTRRPEAYHRKVLAGARSQGDHVASIHDRIVFKQEGLDRAVRYDGYPRKALVDLFFAEETSATDVESGQATDLGDFALGAYEAKLQRKPQRVRLLLSREGDVAGIPIRLTKAISLNAGSSVLEIAYLIEHLPPDFRFQFSVEMNFAGMPPGLSDRYFLGSEQERLGDLGQRLSIEDAHELTLVDEWLGLEAALRFSRPTGFWSFPVQSVNGSEAGFELVPQSIAVQPHWLVVPDRDGRWMVSFAVAINTTRAEQRCENGALVASK